MIAARGFLLPALAAAIRLIGAVPETLCPFTLGRRHFLEARNVRCEILCGQ
jgi:hypothetical protein